MSFNFPDSPTVGQIYEPVLGVSYVWTPPVWRRQVSPSEGMEEAPLDGLTYGRKNEAWSPVVGGALISDVPPPPPLQSGQLWYEADSGVTYIYYDDGNSVQWVQIAGPQSGQQNDYVQKVGDTMSGNLNIKALWPWLVLDKTAANGFAYIGSTLNGIDRWWLNMGNTDADQGFGIERYSDAGAFVDAPIWIYRGNGIVELSRGLKFPAVPVASSDPNTIEAYAEGPWTPALRFGGNSVGMTYSKQQGRFNRTGNKFQAWAWVNLSAKGSSVGVASLAGLPLAAATNLDFYSGTIGYFSSAGVIPGCGVSAGANIINLYNGGASLTDTSFIATSSFMLSVCYEVP